MGDLNTISVENKARREQIELKRREEERRKRAIREKRRKERLIKYYSICIALILLFVLLIYMVFNALFCSGGAGGTAKEESSTKPIVQEVFNPALYKFTDDMYTYENTDQVLEMLDNLKASKGELADKIQFIIDNEAAYPEMLIWLLAKSPETIDFVLEYPFKKGQSTSTLVDISKDYTPGEIPLFIQWDDRWGYVTYGDETISLSGCGPTCLSMVAVGLTGNTKWTPVRTARMAQNGGYHVEDMGTSWSLMYEGCEIMGIKAKEIALSEEVMAAELKAGKPIIASMGPGDFTINGHFIVIVDYKDGQFIVNDPNSRINSSRGWTYEQIKGQIKNIWSYSKID